MMSNIIFLAYEYHPYKVFNWMYLVFFSPLILGLWSEIDDWPPEDISRVCGSFFTGESWVELEANVVGLHTLFLPSSVIQ